MDAAPTAMDVAGCGTGLSAAEIDHAVKPGLAGLGSLYDEGHWLKLDFDITPAIRGRRNNGRIEPATGSRPKRQLAASPWEWERSPNRICGAAPQATLHALNLALTLAERHNIYVCR